MNPDGCAEVREMHAYCLFCETQRCRDIARLIEKMLGYRCISPQIVQRKWTKGKCEDVPHAWLPGYLFLYTEEAIFPRLEISGIIRFLGQGELQNEDLAFAEMIYEKEGQIGTVQLIQEGDRCRLEDPLWENVQGVVIKMDRGRKRCCVEFEFDHIRRTVWVGYDIVRKDDTANGGETVKR